MASSEAASAVLDAGPVIHLDELAGALFLCDDAAARLAAESLGFEAHGTVGVIVRAIRRHTRTVAETKAILDQVPVRSTLHISRALLREILGLLPGS